MYFTKLPFVSRCDVKGKQYLTSGGKYYIADIGLRYYLLASQSKALRL